MTTSIPPAPRRDLLGWAAVVVGVVGVLLAAVLALAQPFAIRQDGVGAVALLAAVRLALAGLLGLVAIVLGVIAVLRRRPRSASGSAGTALGAVLLVDLVVGALYPFVYSLV